MPICFVNPDGSHVRGCDRHMGEHPYDWCKKDFNEKLDRIDELQKELNRLKIEINC
jgi:hypothetical protein